MHNQPIISSLKSFCEAVLTLALTYIVIVFAFCACGGGGSTEDVPDTCDTANINGLYVATYTQTAGDCGTIADPIEIAFTAGTEDVAGCEAAYQQASSVVPCAVEADITCPVSATQYANEVRTVAMADLTGDQLLGASVIHVVDATGAILCASSYNVTYERQ